MDLPLISDYIDIHKHGSFSDENVFVVENLMAHEKKEPMDIIKHAFTEGIHPWFLNEDNYIEQIDLIKKIACDKNIVAIGETGFDRYKGPSMVIQKKAFEEQVKISEEIKKPVIIHCVRAWDELLASYKKLKPSMSWMVHGFSGNIQLASQLIEKGFYISFRNEFVMRKESTELLRNLPVERIFFETDNSDSDIKSIYEKTALDLNITVEKLKALIYRNFMMFFRL
jgi:TatD DNase family protein